jgi:hypothetical protein
LNNNLWLKRLKIGGLPFHLTYLIEIWFRNRSYCVSLDREKSILFDLLLATNQGSILGPVLNAIFVGSLFDLERLFAFADDTIMPKESISEDKLIKDMKINL